MNKKIIHAPLYKTKCQFISSTLYALGEQLDSTEWAGNECYFLFVNHKSRCEAVVKKYYAGNLKIDPRILFDSFKTIKSLIFNR